METEFRLFTSNNGSRRPVRPYRSHHRLQLGLFGLALCTISYRILWDRSNDVELLLSTSSISSEGQRRLVFLDSPIADRSGVYQSSPQFTALVHPSKIDGTTHRGMERYDADDTKSSVCDDVLLYMPHPSSDRDHASQLNSYIQAAMIATYANKAMVLLTPPQWFSTFESGSQFGCPKEGTEGTSGHQFPMGLKRIVKHPEWLSSGCPIPCHGRYMDWEKVRVKRSKNPYYPKHYLPQELRCSNGENGGRLAKVLAVGADEVRDYFEQHFKDQMLQRPSNSALGWAMRLGAKRNEAEVFSRLKEEQEIWDFVSALMSRSALLRFQPWVARDVEAYIVGQSNLPMSESFDAIHVTRKIETEEAKIFLQEYWKTQGYGDSPAPTNYVPFKQYLTRYDNVECNYDKTRLVYIATDDPEEVQKEIQDLPRDGDGNTVLKDGCHKLKFIFRSAEDDISLDESGNKSDEKECQVTYTHSIASISDLMISAKSDLFIGEYNSSWGRLIGIFRAQLENGNNIGGDNMDSDGNSYRPSVVRRMKVAWGADDPLPPGM